MLHAEVIRLHFEIRTIGTAKLELTCIIDEDRWSGGTAALIRNTAVDCGEWSSVCPDRFYSQ